MSPLGPGDELRLLTAAARPLACRDEWFVRQFRPGSAEALTNHPVVAAFKRRQHGAGNQADGMRIALAVEGGGARGVVSAGMLWALEELGLGRAVDVVYGCSSGAVNAAFFLAGNAGAAIWSYMCALQVFFDLLKPAQALAGKPIIDLLQLMGAIMGSKNSLEFHKLLLSPVEFRVLVTNVDAIEAESVGDFESEHDVMATLLASCWLPLASGRTAALRGYRALDGCLLAAHPYDLARAGGATHVLSLSTRPRGSLGPGPGMCHRLLARRLEGQRAGLGSAYLASVKNYRQQRLLLDVSAQEPEVSGQYVLDLAPPPGSAGVSWGEWRSGRLLRGAAVGYETVCRAFGDVRQGAACHAVPPPSVIN